MLEEDGAIDQSVSSRGKGSFASAKHEEAARFEEDGAINQCVAVSESPEDKRDRQRERALSASEWI